MFAQVSWTRFHHFGSYCRKQIHTVFESSVNNTLKATLIKLFLLYDTAKASRSMVIFGLINMKTHLFKSSCQHRALCRCCSLTYSREATHAFYRLNKRHPCALDFMETSVIRSRALSGMLCLIWFKCKPSVPSKSTITVKSLCRLSENYFLFSLFVSVIWNTSKKFLHKSGFRGNTSVLFLLSRFFSVASVPLISLVCALLQPGEHSVLSSLSLLDSLSQTSRI